MMRSNNLGKQNDSIVSKVTKINSYLHNQL